MTLLISVCWGQVVRPFGRRLPGPAHYQPNRPAYSLRLPHLSLSKKQLSTSRSFVACFTVPCGRPPAPLRLAAAAIPCAPPSYAMSCRPTPPRHRGHPSLHAPSCATRTLCSPSRPSTAAPHSLLAHRSHGMHPTTTTPAPPGEGHHRLGHHLPRSAEDITTGRSVCCKHIFQLFHMFQMYVSIVSDGCCKSRMRCCTCCIGYILLLQEYVPNVSFVFSDVCCKCVYLDVFLR
jgi:hypothetical protein